MLIFIVPLKSKQVAKDWTRATRLLERCIHSILSQTSKEFEVIVICHERPEIAIEHPSLSYIEANFPPPVLGQKNIISHMDRDKNQKMWLGLEHARQANPSHVMFVDADDCVSCRISEFVNQNPLANGWLLESGYVYKDGSDRIFYKKSKFYLMSGTSHIIRYSLFDNKNIFSTYRNSSEPLHQLIINILAEQCTPLTPLPFAGAVYIIENGENINADKNSDRSGRETTFSSFKNSILYYPRRFRALTGSQILTKQLIDEFRLDCSILSS